MYCFDLFQMFEYDGSAMLYWHSLGDAGAADSGGIFHSHIQTNLKIATHMIFSKYGSAVAQW